MSSLKKFYTFNHEEESLTEALGFTQKEHEEAIKIYEELNMSEGTFSEGIEKLINLSDAKLALVLPYVLNTLAAGV